MSFHFGVWHGVGVRVRRGVAGPLGDQAERGKGSRERSLGKALLPIPGPFHLLGLQQRAGIAETIKARSAGVLLGRPLELNKSNTPLAWKFKIKLFTPS
jgi:hypothetical protein